MRAGRAVLRTTTLRTTTLRTTTLLAAALLATATLAGCAGGAAAPDAASSDAANDASAADAGAAALCNGAAALCDRRLDELCLPGAHNAMSSAAEGWLFFNQNLAMIDQLELGIRALLLDVHRWDDPSDDGTPADAGVELWLCHGNCQLGHRRFSEALVELRGWLDAHPRELVVVVLEDSAPADAIKAALAEAKLLERAAALTPAGLPTLGALLDAGKQLVWTAEQHGDPPDGSATYHDVWRLVRDTPYTFHSMQELQTYAGPEHSCRPNRGDADAPLLQVNHWVAKVLPAATLSAEANVLSVLLERAAACEALRGQMVNLLVVDHADLGGVVQAARILNGLEAPP